MATVVPRWLTYVTAVDAEILAALMGCQAGDFRRVAADDGHRQFIQQAQGRLGAESRTAGADGVEDDGHAVGSGRFTGCQHGLQGPRLERPQVEDQGPGGSRHFGDFLDGIGHSRRRADGQGRIGAVSHGDEIGDMVNEGPLTAQFLKGPGDGRNKFHLHPPF